MPEIPWKHRSLCDKKIQSDMSKEAARKSSSKITGSGNQRKQVKHTGDLIQKITFATRCLVEKRGMSFATREHF